MEKQKVERKIWLTVVAIFAFPFAIAIIIYSATRVLKPYAQRCNNDGIIMEHLEKIQINCDLCTCNNGIVSCIEGNCNLFDDALRILKNKYPEFANYPNISEETDLGEITLTKEDEDGWYISFLEKEQEKTINSGKCFFVYKYGEIEKIGDAIPNTNYIDVKTCKERVIEINSEKDALDLIMYQTDIIQWISLFEINGGTKTGTPAFETMPGTAEMCSLQTGKDEECYIVKAYEQLSGHNATYNWYYVTFEGKVFSEF